MNKVCKFSKSTRDFVFDAWDKNSLDVGLGGPRSHMVSFFNSNSRLFF